MPQLAARDREGARRAAAGCRRAATRRAGSTASSAATQPVLVEGDGKGHTDNFAPVAIAGAERGETGNARITGRDGDQLTAVWA